MRREWLGDSFDHPKRTVIAGCEECNGSEVYALPMISDSPTWARNDQVWKCYSWLLGFKDTSRILNIGMPFAFPDDGAPLQQQQATWVAQRHAYFNSDAVRGCSGDLFLDPDTGLGFTHAEKAFRIGRPRRTDHRYVYRDELAALTMDSKRVIIVYQHKHRGNPSGYLKEAKQLLSTSHLDCFGYSMSHIAVLFVGRPCKRLSRLRQHFENKLRGTLLARVS